MIGRDGISRKARRRHAQPRRLAFAWLAALALLVQVGFGAAPVGRASAERAAAALSATLGRQVPLCAQGDHAGPPDHSCPCCDDCALCGLACGFALLAPPRADRFAPARGIAVRLARRDEGAAPPAFFSAARPRAPPLFALS